MPNRLPIVDGITVGRLPGRCGNGTIGGCDYWFTKRLLLCSNQDFVIIRTPLHIKETSYRDREKNQNAPARIHALPQLALIFHRMHHCTLPFSEVSAPSGALPECTGKSGSPSSRGSRRLRSPRPPTFAGTTVPAPLRRFSRSRRPCGILPPVRRAPPTGCPPSGGVPLASTRGRLRPGPLACPDTG